MDGSARIRAGAINCLTALCALRGSRAFPGTEALSRAVAVEGIRAKDYAQPPGHRMAGAPSGRDREIGAALKAVDEKIRAHAEIVRVTSELRETLSEPLMTGRLPASP
ncbi:hypothetical protein [Streptomyces sp. NPDC016845]|uniref:hypothetical protein n=1 Tax=Streptomyces sp. NPDC016845 TaxID=3364972 RepID=UPI0037A8D3FF